jgi:Fe-S-cluster-containing dehydrogenase component
MVDEDECTECESCLDACPYEAPQFYDGKLYLCDLCMHRIGEGKPTACEAACPARAIQVGTAEGISAVAGEKPAGRKDSPCSEGARCESCSAGVPGPSSNGRGR